MPRIIPRAEWGWDGWAGTPATVRTAPSDRSGDDDSGVPDPFDPLT